MNGAKFEIRMKSDLAEPVQLQHLPGSFFSGDSNATILAVDVFDHGEPADISGDVNANIIRPDGSTVVVEEGTITGNTCEINLPQEAYEIPGIVTMTVRVLYSTRKTTVAALSVTVMRGITGEIVEPTYDDISGEATEE